MRGATGRAPISCLTESWWGWAVPGQGVRGVNAAVMLHHGHSNHASGPANEASKQGESEDNQDEHFAQ